MNITLISPYHSGSHQSWAEGYATHSQHTVRLLTLPGRYWKWRMHGGAITLARQYIAQNHQPDLILATDMLDLTTFIALTRTTAPTLLYMHENQLTYPLPGDGTGPMRRQKGERDLHYAFINYASMLAADHVLFNSHYHRRTLLAALPNLLKHFPEYNELDTLPQIEAKSSVLPVGIRDWGLGNQGLETGDHQLPPLILWNQRWEYDKNPSAFFQALYTIADEGLPFRLALCGENFRRRPGEFDTAQEKLSQHIIHSGYAKPDHYQHLLWSANITLSTAHHEFFGISILEAIACHTFPILPHRLSYPELIPEQFHHHCLYQNQDGLLQRLRQALTNPTKTKQLAQKLAPAGQKFIWPTLAPTYDTRLQQLLTPNH